MSPAGDVLVTRIVLSELFRGPNLAVNVVHPCYRCIICDICKAWVVCEESRDR